MGKTIGFVGGGRVVSIILGGWSRAGIMPDTVLVHDVNANVLSRLAARHPQVEAGADVTFAAAQDIVFLALHPPVVADVLPQLTPHLQSDAVLVSLAPKFTISKLSQMLGGFSRIARIIPNAPSIVGRGYNPVAFGRAVGAANRDALKKLLVPLGNCPEVPEEHFEAYAIVSAMGPTYFWPQLYELKSLAESFGLSPQAAMEGIDKMLRGTTATMKDSGLSPERVQDLIPVRPLADIEQTVLQGYRRNLTAFMNKLRS